MTSDERLAQIEKVLGTIVDTQVASVNLVHAHQALTSTLVQLVQDHLAISKDEIRDRAIARVQATGADTVEVITLIHAILAEPIAALH